MITRVLDRGWRVLATGFCFAVFGLGGLLLTALGFPMLRLCVRERSARARMAKLWMHYLFRFFVGLMDTLGVLHVQVRGVERLQRPGLLVVANHPSLVDVLFLIACIRQATCVVKNGLLRNPFMHSTVVTAGYLCHDLGAGLLQDAQDALQRGETLIIFPEGSRTPVQGRRPLQRGAAQVAVRTGVRPTPVRIVCEPRMLTKGEPWYRVPVRPGHFLIEVGADIELEPFAHESPAVAARRLTAYLTDYLCLEPERARP